MIQNHMRAIKRIITMEKQTFSDSFSSHGFRGDPDTSPFLNLDNFHMSQPTFRPHPHAGFSAVTYMFEDSRGSFTNRDSFGDHSVIAPGGLHWTQAGSGMMHEEAPVNGGTDCHGLQMFVKLAAANELAPPRAFHLEPGEVPVLETDFSKIRIVVGEFQDTASPLRDLLTPINLFDVYLRETSTFRFEAPDDVTAFAFVIDGSIQVNDQRVQKNEVVLFEERGGRIEIQPASQNAQFLFLSGTKIPEPIVWSGPFCMSSTERLLGAKQRFANGAVVTLSPSF